MADDVQEITQQMREAGWVLGDFLATGGGGAVYYCYSADLADKITMGVSRLASAIASSTSQPVDTRLHSANDIVGPLHRAFAADSDAVAVAKLIKNPGQRSTREIIAMRECRHPSLTRLLAAEDAEAPRWFVMEFHPNGDLERHQSNYQGRPVEVLRKVRPLADALQALHARHMVHRDIKPHNIFVGKTGEWVLGDLGVVFDAKADRLTVDRQTLWSKDWRPDWIAAQRLEDYGPDVDIFGLAKVIYFMISGQRVPASQVSTPACDIRRLFPGVPGIERVHEFIAEHVVTHRGELRSQTAEQFGVAIASLIDDLERPYRRRLAFSFVSTYSTVHVPAPAMSRQLRVPLSLERGERSLFVQFRAMQPPGNVEKPIVLSAHLRKGNTEWTWQNREVHAPPESSDGVTIEPGMWCREIELQVSAEVGSGSCELHFTPGPHAEFLITGLRIEAG